MAVQVAQDFIDMLTSMRDGEQNRLNEIANQLDNYLTVDQLNAQRAQMEDEQAVHEAKKADYDAVLADLEVG